MFQPTKILVPTDFSHPSDKALGEALDIAKQYSAAIYLLHVIPQELDYMCSVDYCVDAGTMQQLQEKVTPGAHQSLQKQMEKFPLSKDVKIVAEVRKGHPAEEILKAQEEKDADLIVMAPLGRTGLAKFLVGSVTDNIVKSARCLVLLVR
ncbi:MAG: universal stress protein [Syntrophorhabdales bacterium]|jgi:nucleotide-binding universal stress UspA family protein